MAYLISLIPQATLPNHLAVSACASSSSLKPSISFSRIVRRYSTSSQLDDAIRLLESHPLSFPVNVDTFSALLHSCITHRSLDHGRRIYRRLTLSKDGEPFLHDPSLSAKFITLFSSSGSLEEAQKIFDDALLHRGFLPQSVWVAMAIGYSRNGLFKKALELYITMLCNDITPENFAFSVALKACARVQVFNVGRGVHAQLIKSRTPPDQVVQNGLIEVYSRSGSFQDVLKLFEKMPERNIVSYNTLISGLLKEGRPTEAFNVFRKMQNDNIRFTWVTLTTILPVCGQTTTLNYGKEIHAQIVKSNNPPDVILMNSLLDMYMKCGAVKYGTTIFNSMKAKDLTSWNSVISGYTTNGRMKEALKLFGEMPHRPNHITFIVLLSGYSHVGRPEEAQELFSKMKTNYNITPTIEHYACLVDALGRGGRIKEALELAEGMPMEPIGSIWGSLLHSCCLYGELSKGEMIASKLFELEPRNAGNYVVLSNLYARMGKWSEMKRVRELMKMKGIKKDVGCSWVHLRGKVHSFVCNGAFAMQNSKDYKEVERKVREGMEARGYFCNSDVSLHGESDEMKGGSVSGHSERLAAMFCLIKTGDGMPVRITKNIRVCVDCHEWMKVLSSVCERQITLRDSARFHHFEDGVCSCNDYW